MKRNLIRWATLFVALTAAVVNADSLVTWDFSTLPATPDGAENAEIPSPIMTAAEATVASGLSVSDITSVGTTYSTAVAPGGVGTQIPGELNAKNWDVGSDGINDSYLSFTLTADSGNVLDISSISTNLWRNGGGAPNGIAFDISVDGGDFVLYDSIITAETTGGGVYDPYVFSESISGASSVEIRFAPRNNGAGSTGNLHIRGFSVDGAVRAVPEPNSLGLLAAGSLALLAIRRRHNR